MASARALHPARRIDLAQPGGALVRRDGTVISRIAPGPVWT
jgi:hypothetical protein